MFFHQVFEHIDWRHFFFQSAGSLLCRTAYEPAQHVCVIAFTRGQSGSIGSRQQLLQHLAGLGVIDLASNWVQGNLRTRSRYSSIDSLPARFFVVIFPDGSSHVFPGVLRVSHQFVDQHFLPLIGKNHQQSKISPTDVEQCQAAGIASAVG